MLKLLISFILLASTTLLQPTWQLNTEKEGIRLYTNTSADGKIKPIKVECTLNATPAQLVAVLTDIKNYSGWVYHTKSASVIKQNSPTDLYYYSEVSVPWPGKNRDFVSHVTLSHDAATKTITIDAPNVTGMVPEKKDVYRTTQSKGKWIITPDGPDHTKVTYYLQIDAGGAVPAWLVNLFITEGPMETFKKLHIQVQKPEYKNALLPFGKN